MDYSCGEQRNRATYLRKSSDASNMSKADNQINRKSTTNSYLDAKSAYNRKYKKLKSPTKEENNTKRLEKAFRAIAWSNKEGSSSETIANINNVSIKQSDINAYFGKRYSKRVCDIMLGVIKFNGSIMKFDEYTENLDKFINMRESEKFKLCFAMFDHDIDGKLSVIDVFSAMNHVKETDLLNMNDLQTILEYIKNKPLNVPNLLTTKSNIHQKLHHNISFLEQDGHQTSNILPLQKIISSRRYNFYLFNIC